MSTAVARRLHASSAHRIGPPSIPVRVSWYSYNHPDKEAYSQGEVLSQGVTLESVIGQDSTQIRVSAEENTVHVPNLPLVPVGTVEQTRYRRYGADLVGVGLDPDPRLVGD